MSNRVLGIITFSLTVVIIVGILYAGRNIIVDAVKPQLLEYAMGNIPEQERKRLYEEAVTSSGFYWDTVPDHEVARIGKKGTDVIAKKSRVRLNNAGLRSSYPYISKKPDTYRIVCLGDSFVFGEAGPEEHRFCNQIGDYYSKHGINIDGKNIETYALGLGSWTAVQEATYLSSRISSYEPDLILMLTVANDITDISGVTGGGTTTTMFSPEHRDWGSGFFSSTAKALLGQRGYTILGTDFTKEGEKRWIKAMSRIKRLVDLQNNRKGKVLLSVLDGAGPNFIETYKKYYKTHGVNAPAIVTNFFSSHETRLAHDGHPNKAGHKILTDHYINVLHALGWVSVPGEVLPDLHEGLSVKTIDGPDIQKMENVRGAYFKYLSSSLDFVDIREVDFYGVLGGIFLENHNEEKSSSNAITWGTIRSGFVLKYPDRSTDFLLRIKIEIPPYIELFPFKLDAFVNGKQMKPFLRETPGEVTLEYEVPSPSDDELALEVVLRSNSYFSSITDHRMKSYRFIEASLVKKP